MFLVRNATRTTKSFFDTIKTLEEDTQKNNMLLYRRKRLKNFNKFFTTIGKTLADKLGPEKKSTKNKASIACFYTKLAKKCSLWQSKPEQ